MKVIAATHNKGKIVEFFDIVKNYGMELISWDDAGLGDLEIDENGTTCEENSFIKADTICKLKNMAAIADDTGLFVDALNGAPGIHTARYAGEDGNDAANRALLLKNLEGVPYEKRTARFMTVLTLLLPDGTQYVAKGVCEGHIAESERGDRGFGYDSVFIPEGQEQTFAELPLEYKDAVSHRARALKKLAEML